VILPPPTTTAIAIGAFAVPTRKTFEAKEPTDAEVSECEVWLERAWKASPTYARIMDQMRPSVPARKRRKQK
jgi:hypothetical protein